MHTIILIKIFEEELTLLSSQVGHISHCLYSFTQTRFICEDPIELFLIQIY